MKSKTNVTKEQVIKLANNQESESIILNYHDFDITVKVLSLSEQLNFCEQVVENIRASVEPANTNNLVFQDAAFCNTYLLNYTDAPEVFGINADTTTEQLYRISNELNFIEKASEILPIFGKMVNQMKQSINSRLQYENDLLIGGYIRQGTDDLVEKAKFTVQTVLDSISPESFVDLLAKYQSEMTANLEQAKTVE